MQGRSKGGSRSQPFPEQADGCVSPWGEDGALLLHILGCAARALHCGLSVLSGLACLTSAQLGLVVDGAVETAVSIRPHRGLPLHRIHLALQPECLRSGHFSHTTWRGGDVRGGGRQRGSAQGKCILRSV